MSASADTCLFESPAHGLELCLRREREFASQCCLPTVFTKLPLLSKVPYNHDCAIFEFGLPPGVSHLSLPTCSCLLLCAPGAGPDGADAVRPYTPINPEGMQGKFQLLIKRYPSGAVSSFVHNLPIGGAALFKHIPYNLKLQYPFQINGALLKKVSMLGAGTGITPLFQALHKLLEAHDTTEVVLLYGNRTEKDILLRDELEERAKNCGRFRLVHILSRATEKWAGERGRVGRASIEKHIFPPAEDTCVFVCGPPPMYASCCGPREEKGLAEGSALQALGYTPAMVFKF